MLVALLWHATGTGKAERNSRVVIAGCRTAGRLGNAGVEAGVGEPGEGGGGERGLRSLRVVSVGGGVLPHDGQAGFVSAVAEVRGAGGGKLVCVGAKGALVLSTRECCEEGDWGVFLDATAVCVAGIPSAVWGECGVMRCDAVSIGRSVVGRSRASAGLSMPGHVAAWSYTRHPFVHAVCLLPVIGLISAHSCP